MTPSKWIMVVDDLLAQVQTDGTNAVELGSSWASADNTELGGLMMSERIYLVATHPRLNSTELRLWRHLLLSSMSKCYNFPLTAELCRLRLTDPKVMAARNQLLSWTKRWEEAWFGWHTNQPDWHLSVGLLMYQDRHMYPDRLLVLAELQHQTMSTPCTNHEWRLAQELDRIIFSLGTRIQDVSSAMNTVGME